VAQDEEHLRILEAAGLQSYICVPLRTRTETIGALTLIHAESGRIYDEADLAVAQEVGWRAGLAVEKARMYEQSQLARAELERSNQAKDEFLGIVSHELKSPLAIIYGDVRFLRTNRAHLDSQDVEKLLADAEEESGKLSDLIDDFLMLARLDVGKPVNKVALDLARELENWTAGVRASGRPVDVRLTTSRPEVHADPTYLEHILANLMSNADKYSLPDEPIEVVVEDAPGGVTLRVMDRGPGVSSSELALIFDSFYRSDQTAHLPGKGLGLAICRRLVEAQGGHIWAALRTTGGLEVSFFLPDAAAAGA
jgi:K+-sensing histidine kinase KdpD